MSATAKKTREIIAVKAEPVPATTPAQLLAIAVQSGADLDRLDKLMALQERWEANEARKAYVQAMTAFKAQPVEIIKAKHVSFTTRSGDTTSYNHAELSDITDSIGPALSASSLSYRWNVKQENGSITVECIMTHVAGHSESVSMSAPPDNSGGKNTIQQIASTTTYLQRYTLLALTGLSTKGADDDGRGSDKPEVDPAWYLEIKEAGDEDYLRAVKASMVENWKGATNIPKDLVSAYNARLDELRKGNA